MKMELITLLLFLASAQWIDGEFLGCYEDNEIRLLPDFHMYLDGVNDPTKCSYICQRLQYQYAGVEGGNQCFCSKDRPYERMKRNITECNMPCPSSGEVCGGSSRISVYSVGSNIIPTTDQGTYIGCYLESKNDRTVRNYQAYLLDINDPKRCLHLCTVLGYMYAGTEPGNSCFCGNTKPADEKKAEESECQATCPHSENKCGGEDRIAIFRTSVNSNAESVVTVSEERLKRNALGCFEDSEYRILSKYFTRLYDTNSPQNCMYLCQQYHFQFAGVENGLDCYCGNKKPSQSRKRKDTECQTSCPNSSERCGGEMRIYVYATKMFQTRLQPDLRTSDDHPFFMKKYLQTTN